MYDNILVATDGSEHSARACDHAVETAVRFDARLHVLHAVSPRLSDVFSSDSVENLVGDATEHGEEVVEEVAAEARKAGADVVTHVEQRVPHEAILEYAEENDVDLIVVGSRGRSEKSLSDRLLGGVSAKVVYTAEVPVLTVR